MPQLYPNLFEAFTRFTVSLLLVALSLFLVWLAAIIDIVRNDFKVSVDKVIWFFFVMLLPPVGIVLYFTIGRSQKITADPPIRSTRYRDIGRD